MGNKASYFDRTQNLGKWKICLKTRDWLGFFILTTLIPRILSLKILRNNLPTDVKFPEISKSKNLRVIPSPNVTLSTA